MKRILRISALAMVLITLLIVSITGPVLAAGDNAKVAQNQYEECPCPEPYGDCIPNLWGKPGPHGQGNAVPVD